MENATKALLIAAAVLVAILVISLGLIVYNKSSETVNQAGDLSEYEIQQFNEKFMRYEGENVTSSEVTALIKTVFNHNLAQPDDLTCVGVSVVNGSSNSLLIEPNNDATTLPEQLAAGRRYSVECQIDSNTKLIRTIFIEGN